MEHSSHAVSAMIYLSIDVEASGPFPGLHYLCSIGAAAVRTFDGVWQVDRDRTFYVELQPLEGADELPEAMRIHGLTRDHLAARGETPATAMAGLRSYLASLGGPFRTAAWPISFDHPYVGLYLQRFGGDNPLGHSGLDIASYAMGLFGKTSRRATFAAMEAAGYRQPRNDKPHDALHDAIEQGETLAWLLEHARAR